MNDHKGEPLIVVRHLREVDDAGTKHYEAVVTGRWFDGAESDGALRLKGNIRPDWQTGKQGVKTKRKVDRWAEELLQNNAVMGNLSIRLDPSSAEFEMRQDEDGDWTMIVWSGGFDTAVDSQSRITAILKAARNPLGTFNPETTFATRIWVADDDLAARVGSDYNTRGDKVNDTAAKFAYQDTAEKRIARMLLTDSGHLGVDNVEVLKNNVSASSSKLVAFNTLTQAMESNWHGEPITQSEEEEQAKFLVSFWDELVKVRPEFGRLGKSDRQALRGASIAGTALSIYGVIAIADKVRQAGLDPRNVLGPLAEPVDIDGAARDYFSYENPVWTRIGALVLAEDRAGNERLTLRMSFQTRKAVAEELLRRTGLAA
ncbi:DNA sulfur modification protein DndB [Pimelobacter simplex]|uniref:DNA sulfur modification protein DndB n=1 Tax=Nocardioides simplex TaxID=2045 RepID=UPI0021502964|nr:DNA sulfur modification protein DndB [Pimelobacter simplex]UUW92234.1 hypothetical protein M0M43_12355 [Pimelobacter simplex]UUW96061.1 hypothetical protein M0M48_00985 [Pimelobacter simplex]